MPGEPPVGIERASGSPGARGAFRSPSWSADGKRLVFDRDLGTWPPYGYTWSRDSRYRVLRTGIFPSFSPRGDRLVENNGPSGAAHNSIVIVAPNGSKSVLFDDPMRDSLAPKWSPHGDQIVFAIGEFLQTLAGRENLTSHLALIPASGGAIQEFTAAGEHVGFPSWSPDATKVVYASFDRGQRGLRIFDLKAQRVTQVTTGPDTFPAWSPHGDRIAFTSNRDGDYEIYTVRPDGRGITRLTKSPGNDAHPAWSDGRGVDRVREQSNRLQGRDRRHVQWRDLRDARRRLGRTAAHRERVGGRHAGVAAHVRAGAGRLLARASRLRRALSAATARRYDDAPSSTARCDAPSPPSSRASHGSASAISSRTFQGGFTTIIPLPVSPRPWASGATQSS